VFGFLKQFFDKFFSKKTLNNSQLKTKYLKFLILKLEIFFNVGGVVFG